MRSVQVYDLVMAPTPKRTGPWVERPLYQGNFLGFSSDSEELEYGSFVFPVAMVETDQGRVEAIYYKNIRFLDKAEKVKAKPKNGEVPYQKIIDAYHKILPMLSRVRVLTSHRKQQMQRRWNNEFPDLDAWKAYFNDIAESKFLTGKAVQSDGWKADIDWLLKPGNIAKVSEGKYHA